MIGKRVNNSEIRTLLKSIRSQILAIEDVIARRERPSEAALARQIFPIGQASNEASPIFEFAQPAWNILLHLYISQADCRSVLPSELCLKSGVDATEAILWLRQLEVHRLVVRRPAVDHRGVTIELSELAHKRLTLLLRHINPGFVTRSFP